MGRLLFLLFVFFLPIESWALVSMPTKDIEVRLAPSVTVSGERIVLGDVATIYAKSMRDFHRLSDLVISQIPEDQGELKLPQSYLERRIREALPAGVEFALHAPAEIVFRLDRLGISPADFVAEVERQARDQNKIPKGIEVAFEPISGMDQLKLYKPGTVDIEAAAQSSQWKGELIFKVVPKSGQTALQPIAWVKAKARWFAKVWTAKQGVTINQQVDAKNFELIRQEITSLREDPLAAENEEQLAQKLGNARARRNIAGNAVLTAGMLERKPDAAPGQALKVIFVSENGIRVTTDGALLGSGIIGNDVKAKLRSSRKIVTGKLVSGGVMEVTL
jgi:flagella basal body P-ring formation protein FlgA